MNKGLEYRILAGRLVMMVPILTAVLGGTATAAAIGQEAGADMLLKDFLYRSINFAIMCGIILYFVARPLQNKLGRRRFELRENLEAAKKARSLAEAKLADLEAKLAQRDREMLDMRHGAEKANQKERENALQEVTALSEKIIRETEELAKREIKEARRQLRHEAARMVVAVAEQQLREKSTPEDSLRLVHENIEKMEKRQ